MLGDDTCGRWLWVESVQPWWCCTLSAWYHTPRGKTWCHKLSLSSNLVTRAFYSSNDPLHGVRLFCVRGQVVMGSLALAYPKLPCLALAESVQYSLQLVLDTPGPQPENIQPDTPIPDDSEQGSHPEPGQRLTQRRSFWEACQNVNSDSWTDSECTNWKCPCQYHAFGIKTWFYFFAMAMSVGEPGPII